VWEEHARIAEFRQGAAVRGGGLNGVAVGVVIEAGLTGGVWLQHIADRAQMIALVKGLEGGRVEEHARVAEVRQGAAVRRGALNGVAIGVVIETGLTGGVWLQHIADRAQVIALVKGLEGPGDRILALGVVLLDHIVTAIALLADHIAAP